MFFYNDFVKPAQGSVHIKFICLAWDTPRVWMWTCWFLWPIFCFSSGFLFNWIMLNIRECIVHVPSISFPPSVVKMPRKKPCQTTSASSFGKYLSIFSVRFFDGLFGYHSVTRTSADDLRSAGSVGHRAVISPCRGCPLRRAVVALLLTCSWKTSDRQCPRSAASPRPGCWQSGRLSWGKEPIRAN